MSFEKKLNDYIEILDCTSKKLADSANLSTSLISRYRNGERVPKIDSEQFDKLVYGLYKVAHNKNLDLTKTDISTALGNEINPNNVDFEIFRKNFNIILSELDINTAIFASSIGYDSSFISRIKNGNRKPANINKFIDDFCDYVVSHYKTSDSKANICSIINVSTKELKSDSDYKLKLTEWLCTNEEVTNNAVGNFLKNIDIFDENSYNNNLKYSKLNIPTSPVIFRISKNFYGIKEMKNAEAEFIRTTVISKSNEPLFLYNEMPMNEISEDEELQKKWMLGISMLLKKGIHLNIIHNVDRPINEMIIGLESWLPIYMIGNISPYYLDKSLSDTFSYMHCTSGSVCLVGECPKGQEEKSKLYLTTKKDEIEYYKMKTEILLHKAKPLMTIYKPNDKKKFYDFIKREENKSYTRIKKDSFKNIDFYINDKWIIINKNDYSEMRFVITNSKLRNAIENFLLK